MTYGDLFSLRYRFRSWLHNLLYPELLTLDIEQRKLAMIHRRMNWFGLEAAPGLADIVFKESPLFKRLKEMK